MGAFYDKLFDLSKKIDFLQGDAEYAKSNGAYNDRSEEVIQDEIESVISTLNMEFEEIEKTEFWKFIKI